MKKTAKIIIGLLLAAIGLPASAQRAQDALYIFRNDGQFNAFFWGDIQRFAYSKVDTLGVEHDDYVVQEVYALDSVFRIPVSAIDSIAFVTPENKVKSDVVIPDKSIADYIVASEKAKFGQPEAGLGITPGFGGTQRLPRKIGVSKAKELIFSARVISAQEAYELGIVDKLVAPEELMDKVMELMNSFTKNAPIAVANCKKAIDEGYQLDIDGGVKTESKWFGKCFATEDQKEGMKAFLEKRPAEFKNK